MQMLKFLATTLKEGLRTISPNCREVSQLQSAALDQPLSFPKRVGLRLHLLLCKWCRRYGRQIRFLQQASREHADELPQAGPRGLSPDARERLRASLRSGPKP